MIIIITPHLVGEDTQWNMSDQMKDAFNEGQTEYHSMNKVNANVIEPEVEKEIIRIKEKRAEDKAKKEQKAAEKEAKRAAKEIAKQRKKAEENGYAREKSALRDRISSILRNDAANNAASSKPAPEQNVTVVLPSKEEIVVEQPVLAEEPVIMEQPAANSGEEAALGDYLNR